MLIQEREDPKSKKRSKERERKKREREKENTKFPTLGMFRRSPLTPLPPKPPLLRPPLLIKIHSLCSLTSPSSFTPPLLAPPNIPPTSTATTLSQRNQPSQNRTARRNPHESKHLRANLPLDIQLLDGRDGVLHDDEHCCCEDCCDGGEEGGQEGEDCYGEVGPARIDCEEHEWDHDCAEAGAREEEAEHPVGDEADDVEDFGNFGGEGDW